MDRSSFRESWLEPTQRLVVKSWTGRGWGRWWRMDDDDVEWWCNWVLTITGQHTLKPYLGLKIQLQNIKMQNFSNFKLQQEKIFFVCFGFEKQTKRWSIKRLRAEDLGWLVCTCEWDNHLCCVLPRNFLWEERSQGEIESQSGFIKDHPALRE